jgi:hypothetical protein
MPDATRRANAAKSKIRSRVEHVFAAQKDRMRLFVRTIGIARSTVKIGMANIVYKSNRLLFRAKLRIPTMSATCYDLMSATCYDLKPDGVPILCRPP